MIYLIFFICCVLLSSSFSSLETAFLTANPLKVSSKIKNNKKIEKIMVFFNHRDLVINTVLVGNNLANISAGILLLLFFKNHQSYPLTQALLFSTSITTLVILLFGEIIPKSFSLRFSTQIVIFLYPLLQIYIWVLYPFSFVMRSISRFIFKSKEKDSSISREEVEFLFYKEEKDHHLKDDHDFIYQVFNLASTKVKKIMIPLNDLMRVELFEQQESVMQKIKQSFYSRLPVYQEDSYNVIGYIESKNLIYRPKKSVEQSLLTTLFFPETKTADEALFEMQKEKKPLAFVVDEYGAVSGMITKEDLLELIVGNIEDEMHYDDKITPIGQGWIVPGWENVDHLNSRLNLEIIKEDFETLSGFAAFMLKKIPEKEDQFVYKNFCYQILEVQNRVAEKIQITFKKNR